MSLEDLGIDSVTEAVYRAMLANPGFGVEQLTAAVGVAAEQVRAALDTLARLSLLRSATEARPVSPRVGLEALLASKQTEIARRMEEIERSRLAVAHLLASYESRADDVGPEVRRLEGIDEVREQLSELARTCERSADSLMPGGAQSAASLEASQPLDEAAIARGVRIRTVYLDSVRNDARSLEYARWLSVQGSEVRTAPSLPIRMLIVDGTRALVPLATADTRQGAVLLTGEGVVAALSALFRSVWSQATPLGVRGPRDSNGLSALERQVLVMWSAGYTDERIGREVGVSLRTVRRVAADLMTRLDARSRFQAGALALAKGWLNADDLA